MSKDYSKDRYIPSTCNTPLLSNEFFDFFWNEKKEYPVCIVFSKKAKNKFWYYGFLNYDSMMKKVKETISNAVSRKKTQEEYKAKRNQPHTLKVGDILYASWGYDQTNIDFFKVVDLVGKTQVKIIGVDTEIESVPGCESQDLATPASSSSQANIFTRKYNPTLKKYEPITLLKKVNGSDNSIRISSYAWATPYKPGQNLYQTASGFGH